MTETVETSAHEDCARTAACGEGDGPCVVALQSKIRRLEGKACLICGRDTPCELDTNVNDDPNWPGSPCTFDPSPIDAAIGFMAQRDKWRGVADCHQLGGWLGSTGEPECQGGDEPHSQPSCLTHRVKALAASLRTEGGINYTEGNPRWHLRRCRRRGSLHPLGWADCDDRCKAARAALGADAPKEGE